MSDRDEAQDLRAKHRYAIGEEIKALHAEIAQSSPHIEHLRASWRLAHAHFSQVADPEEKHLILTQIELMRPGIEDAEQQHAAFHADRTDRIHALEGELKRRDEDEELARRRKGV